VNMENNINKLPEGIPDPEDIREQYPIEEDSDTLEPFDDSSEHRVINADDPQELEYWSGQFQMSTEALKAVVVLRGNSVREVKKYLSV